MLVKILMISTGKVKQTIKDIGVSCTINRLAAVLCSKLHSARSLKVASSNCDCIPAQYTVFRIF